MSAYSLENPRPKPRSSLSGPPRPLVRSTSQIIAQNHIALSRQHSFDHGFSSTSGSLEPLAKRQKVEPRHVGAVSSRYENSPSNATAALVPSSRLERSRSTKIHEDSKIVASGSNIDIPPFPSRPGRLATKSPATSLSKANPTTKASVQGKPYTIEPPKFAPRYGNGDRTDFHPWTGDHLEDVLNEHSIKTGYYDKSPIVQNESGTARNSIWSCIKHKSGLQILSSLFVSTLELRQRNGIVAPSSIFKPPPRATLTEPKREAWLKDLADPSIPLRRLSRTIPHGIRGKMLLDQCLAKKIPEWRALWLVKCVGANEIRAFKRKGTSGTFSAGGETKWVRDWTSSIEQFLETLIESCGTTEWTNAITYALQLIAHIYAEQLLDQEQFLDWIISSLRSASMKTLPIWLLMIHMFWADMPIYRNRGRMFALALTEQAYRIRGRGIVTASLPVWSKLVNTLVGFMIEQPSCFFMPLQWTKYAPVLEFCTGEKPKSVKSCFSRIQQRNETISKLICVASYPSDKQQRILAILDHGNASFDVPRTSKICLEAAENHELLILTTIRWATSQYRPGLFRVYLATRLLRRWAKAGVQLDEGIYIFMKEGPEQTDTDRERAFKVLLELIRSRHISVTRLLQWIMARDPSYGSTVKQAFHIELLRRVPLQVLPNHTLNLRDTLLAKKSRHIAAVRNELQVIQAFLRHEISFLGPPTLNTGSESLASILITLEELEPDDKLDLAHWLRNGLLSYAFPLSDQTDSFSEPRNARILSTVSDLQILCKVLENLEDFAVLADILRIFSEKSEPVMLNSILDITNYHFDILHSIGATAAICDIILGRLQQITTRSISQKPLLLALVDLVRRLPKKRKTLVALEKELVLCEPKSAAAAYSPVSDHMIETLQTSDAVLFEEVEALFGSGSSIDKPTLSRIFADITRRLECSWIEEVPSSISLVEILAKLRSFDQDLFDSRLLSWLGTMFLVGKVRGLKTVIVLLVCSGLVHIKKICERLMSQTDDIKAIPTKILLVVLDFFTTTSTETEVPRIYRFRSQAEQIIKDEPCLVAKFVKMILERCSAESEPGIQLIHAISSRPEFLNLIRTLAISKLAAQNIFGTSLNPGTKNLSEDLLNKCLHLENAAEDERSPQDLLDRINYFNIELYHYRLKILLNREEKVNNLNAETLSKALVRKIMSSERCRLGLWRGLAESLPTSILKTAHGSAISCILALAVPTSEALQHESSKLCNDEQVERLIVFLSAIEQSLAPEDMLEGAICLVENLARLQGILNPLKLEEGSKSRVKPGIVYSQACDNFAIWLDISLRTICIHHGVFNHTKFSGSTIFQLSLILSLMYANDNVDIGEALHHRIFDTLVLITDSMTAATRAHCMQILMTQHNLHDQGLQFLFGPPENDLDTSFRLVLNPDHEGDEGRTKFDQTTKSTSFAIRRWEMVQDATPAIGDNDTSLSLALFGARKAVIQ